MGFQKGFWPCWEVLGQSSLSVIGVANKRHAWQKGNMDRELPGRLKSSCCWPPCSAWPVLKLIDGRTESYYSKRKVTRRRGGFSFSFMPKKMYNASYQLYFH